MFFPCLIRSCRTLPLMRTDSGEDVEMLPNPRSFKVHKYEITTPSGTRYFITFIDDFSRKTWVYFLKQKLEACEAFKTFKAFVETQSGYRIKELHFTIMFIEDVFEVFYFQCLLY